MWDPQTYLAFADERIRPARDLLAAVDLAAPDRVVDLGCGPGNSTQLLRARWPAADVLGVDSSPQMVARARADAAPEARGGARYEVGDAATWLPSGPVDLIFANALLQWVPGHLELLPRWLDRLTPGGRLAFGVPGNFEAPTHVLLREICATPTWQARLGDLADRREAICTPRAYADALAAAGARPDVWETTYLHRLTGPDPVLEWVSGTALRPVLDALAADPPAQEAFRADYGAALRAAYPPGPDGVTTLEFRRVFAVAARP